MVYIGPTGRELSQRMTEHKRVVKSAHLNSSVLAEQAWSTGHPVDWEKACVSNCLDLHSRLVHKASTKKTRNKDTGTLSSIYDDIVDALSGMS